METSRLCACIIACSCNEIVVRDKNTQRQALTILCYVCSQYTSDHFGFIPYLRYKIVTEFQTHSQSLSRSHSISARVARNPHSMFLSVPVVCMLLLAV